MIGTSVMKDLMIIMKEMQWQYSVKNLLQLSGLFLDIVIYPALKLNFKLKLLFTSGLKKLISKDSSMNYFSSRQ